MPIKPDPEDGLPAMEAGEWAEEKHDLLRQYVELSRGARRIWLEGSNGATYIELFAGPGRTFLKGTTRFSDGSPLVVHAEAARWNTRYSEMHLGDASSDFCDALTQRLTKRDAKIRTYPVAAATAIDQICSSLNRNGLHFAFLDPFKIDGLPFTIIEKLSKFRYMDVLIHVSAMDIQRNLPRWVKSAHCPLDDFAPEWRHAVGDSNPSDIVARGLLLEHWVSLIRKTGFAEAEVKHLIRGETNQPLYWLVLIAKHDLALKFWNAINDARPHNLDFFRDG